MERVRSVDGGNQPKENWEVFLPRALGDPDNDHEKKKKKPQKKEREKKKLCSFHCFKM